MTWRTTLDPAHAEPRRRPLRPLVVEAAGAYMDAVRQARSKELLPKVVAETRRLRAWADGRLDQLEDQLKAEKRASYRARLQQEMDRVERLRDDRATWYSEALAIDRRPYLRLAAVFVPRGHAIDKS